MRSRAALALPRETAAGGPGLEHALGDGHPHVPAMEDEKEKVRSLLKKVSGATPSAV